MLSENRLGVDDEGSRDMGYKENEEEPPPEGMHLVCSLVRVQSSGSLDKQRERRASWKN